MSDALVAAFGREVRAQNFARWQRGAIYARERGPGLMLVDVRGALTLDECLARPMRYVRTRDLALHFEAETRRSVIAHLVSERHPRGASFTLVRGNAEPAARTYEMCAHYRRVDTDAAGAPVPERFRAWLRTVRDNVTDAQRAWFYYANGTRNLVLCHTSHEMGGNLSIAHGRARGAPPVVIDPFGDDIGEIDDEEGTHTCAELDGLLTCRRCPHRYVFVRSLKPRVLALAASSGWHVSRGVLAPNVNCDEAAEGARLVLWAPFHGPGSVGCYADGCARDAELDPACVLQMCSGCKIYRYCSPECACADWAEHKASCDPIRRRRLACTCAHNHD